ncbi:DUF4097 family beta strand repeat-containing protein [Cohnella panacarvi]|uniref:DUF4097 family beta strand repeat-containing protein n=1 Tax=Cohnella panacarvi TaxID=400776 RepID=UPI001FDF5E90|nr:DUF4097 family beta strand repeat-containing protein [Cohnella panacarvi]
MFRKRRMLLLLSVAALFCLMIADFWTNKAESFERFGKPFVNERKTDAYDASRRESVATAEKELTIPREDLAGVSLSSVVEGRISVNRSEDAMVRLRYTITATARDADLANRKRDAVQIDQVARDGRLALKASVDGKRVDWNDDTTIDYVLLVPDGMNVRVESENATVRIEGTVGDATATAIGELLEVVDVQGNVTATSDYGNIYLSGITGDIELINRSADANLIDIRGNVAIDNHSGRNFLRSIAGKVSGETKGGPVYMWNVDGAVELRSRNGDLQLEDVRGDIRVTADNGKTSVILPADSGYRLNAATAGGRFRTTLPFPVESERKGDYSLRGTVGDGKWQVDVTSEDGNIVIYAEE